MADELTLPTLPKVSWDPATGSFANHRTRKRVRSSPPVSSDPALFSSDDDPSADNYTQERRKRQYRGPWFQQIPAESRTSEVLDLATEKGKRPFERQYDSGIFMGSDGTEMDEMMEALEDVQFKRPRLPSKHWHSRPSIQLEKLASPAEDLARAQIERCLEGGDECIDLSSRGLTSISNSMIRPLSTFTCIPPVTEGVFSHLEPKLKVFLTANSLSTLPEELFKLETLNVLSLRINAFEELPPGIGNLHNLRELNISQNRLRYLPFEILDLFSSHSNLENLQLHPNPFFEPQFPAQQLEQVSEPQYKIGLRSETRTRPRRGAVSYVPPDLGRRSWHNRWRVTYKARTEIRYLGPDGVLIQGPKLPGTSDAANSVPHKSLEIAEPHHIQHPPEPRGEHHSHAPSLLEVALAACSQSPQLPHLPSLLHDECPAYLSELLAKAVAKKDSGGSKCTICNRNFIIPRAEWIEWWGIAKGIERKVWNPSMVSAASPLRFKEMERDVIENMVPLIRRSCSWLCVPKMEIECRSDEMDLDH